MERDTWNLNPSDIETRSMAIIDAQAGEHGWLPDQWQIVRRMIHTTADFEWAGITIMQDQALESGLKALTKGCTIFTDTQMAMMGISPWRVGPLGVDVRCLINYEPVMARAAENGTTRAVAAVDLAVESDSRAVFVVGNAPTALLRLLEHAEAGRAHPPLVVGLPVGFVNAAEAKAALAQSDLPYITALGPKGGSAVAASVINALAIMAQEQRK
ncbi:MAG: precorrin-8X methylmutase [Deltaproteobacteria bacterium]|nr:precorrin-8X methylmutase [Deltaproteobacteria bacterium]